MGLKEARELEVKPVWGVNTGAWACPHCSKPPLVFYIVTGHDHTYDSFWWCKCREIQPENANPYGCFNYTRKKGYWTQVRVYDGDTYKLQDKFIQNVMSTDCRYDRAQQDKRCAGCTHMPKKEELWFHSFQE